MAGHLACKKTRCWFVVGDVLTAALHVLLLQLLPRPASTLISSNKIHNGDILVSDNPGPPGKWSLKRRNYKQ